MMALPFAQELSVFRLAKKLGWLLLWAACAPSGEAPEQEDVTVAGGNSGSENRGAATVPCPCSARTWARVDVLARDGVYVTVRVVEPLVLGTDLKVGEEIRAPFAQRLPCYRGVSDVESGDQAIAVLSRANSEQPSSPWTQIRLTHDEPELFLAQVGRERLTIPFSAISELATLEQAECIEKYGDWARLSGSDQWRDGTDGTSDDYWCADPDSQELASCWDLADDEFP